MAHRITQFAMTQDRDSDPFIAVLTEDGELYVCEFVLDRKEKVTQAKQRWLRLEVPKDVTLNEVVKAEASKRRSHP